MGSILGEFYPPVNPGRFKLVVLPEEADVVRHVFERYLALGSVRRLQSELVKTGYLTPVRTSQNGRTSGGCALSKGKLYAMLANPVVVGKIRHREKVYDGQHDAIISETTWDQVQTMLADNRRSHCNRSHARNPSPLAGRLFDPAGNRMRPVHTTKNGRRYRYYVSPALIDSGVEAGARGWRIPADEIETALAKAILGHLECPDTTCVLLAGRADAKEIADVLRWLSGIRQDLHDPRTRQCRQLIRTITRRVDLTKEALAARIDLTPALDDRTALKDVDLPPVDLTAAIRLTRRGAELKLILQGAGSDPCTPDPNLIKTILDARQRFAAYTRLHNPKSISEIAIAAGASTGDISRSMQLVFLAPDLIEAILDGRQPCELTATRLLRLDRLPQFWGDQHLRLA